MSTRAALGSLSGCITLARVEGAAGETEECGIVGGVNGAGALGCGLIPGVGRGIDCGGACGVGPAAVGGIVGNAGAGLATGAMGAAGGAISGRAATGTGPAGREAAFGSWLGEKLGRLVAVSVGVTEGGGAGCATAWA